MGAEERQDRGIPDASVKGLGNLAAVGAWQAEEGRDRMAEHLEQAAESLETFYLSDTAALLRCAAAELRRLREEVDWYRTVIAEEAGYTGPAGDGCNPLRNILQDARTMRDEALAQRADYERLSEENEALRSDNYEQYMTGVKHGIQKTKRAARPFDAVGFYKIPEELRRLATAIRARYGGAASDLEGMANVLESSRPFDAGRLAELARGWEVVAEQKRDKGMYEDLYRNNGIAKAYTNCAAELLRALTEENGNG